jgi:hypothetical protein
MIERIALTELPLLIVSTLQITLTDYETMILGGAYDGYTCLSHDPTTARQLHQGLLGMAQRAQSGPI